ncbi:sulfotransferase family protein (plasmid) [Paracoccus liaowanqingii]|uniref:Sulfotransferase family protein n=1 Tax=Paracoccus liaowanqingii TaxID=2560053 RepID=A0A4Y5SQD9_9RHOB|nr:sulfotransferase family protein [Paracoccus liaowanqingii]
MSSSCTKRRKDPTRKTAKVAIIVDKIRLAYFPSPKVACTSVKYMFYKLENGRDFVDGIRNSTMFHIHSYYGSSPFSAAPLDRLAAHERICIVRDPIKRFLSCYSNRVLFHRELSEHHLSPEAIAAGAVPDPSLKIFTERLNIYRKHSSSIRHHTDPQTHFIGPDPKFYSKIYQMGNLDELASDLSLKSGIELDLPHAQNGGEKINPRELSADLLDRIREFYRKDYEAYNFV